MPYRPYPNAARAHRQLDRHTQETGPAHAVRPLSPPGQQLVNVFAGLRDQAREVLVQAAPATRPLLALQDGLEQRPHLGEFTGRYVMSTRRQAADSPPLH